MTQERDAAVAQLGVAYLTTEQLKAENEILIEENNRLKAQLAQFTARNSNDAHGSTRIDNNPLKKTPLPDFPEPHSFLTMDNHQNTAGENSRKIASSRLSRQSEVQTDDHQESRVSTTKENTLPQPETTSGAQIDLSGRKRIKKTRMILEEYSESEKSDDSLHESAIVQSAKPKESLPREAADADASKDITLLSFLEVSHSRLPKTTTNILQTGDIAKLRKTLEEERIVRKQQRGPSSKSTRPTDDITVPVLVDAAGSSREQVMPRKSSMKSTTGRSSRRGDDTIHTQTEFDQVCSVTT